MTRGLLATLDARGKTYTTGTDDIGIGVEGNELLALDEQTAGESIVRAREGSDQLLGLITTDLKKQEK